ncbi:facilitated trehalose transporter Tret1-2 homolog [Homarus americanus]|uniref:facilitated trehalose transporter Tret1-2 homolog n=1 Tax=Homarus americanus TaxID=6706 RepID=UPI001C43F8D2|nr:facilitated trehalose transporter Tret1-2 homolog [Homarus americanus]
MDMLGSLVPAGSVPGTCLGAIFVSSIGRRRSIMVLLLPTVVGWGMIAFAVNPAMILFGRFFNGVTCGMSTVSANTYIVELPDAAVRGTLFVIPTFFIIIGYVLTIASGLVLRWYQIPFLGISVSAACFIVMLFMPESPTYLVITDQKDEARKVLRNLRGPDVDVDEEINTLRSVNEKMISQPLLKVLRQPVMVKNLSIIFILFFIMNFSGLPAIIINTTRIFLDAGSEMNENLATIIVLLMMFVGSGLSLFFLDRIGRKKSLIASLTVTAICLLILGTFIHCKHIYKISIYSEDVTSIYNFTAGTTSSDNMMLGNHMPNAPVDSSWTSEHSWVPLVCLLVYMASASFGLVHIPFILSNEYFPTAVRAQASSACLLVSNVFCLMALQLYTPMQMGLTPAGLCWFNAAVCVFGVVFCTFFIWETKGRNVG